jgi:hypothetical protein
MSSQQFLQVTVILKKYGASFFFFHGTRATGISIGRERVANA